MKHLSFLLVIAMLLSITSCSTATTNNTQNNQSTLNETASSTECKHTWISATCTTPKTCSKCKETIGVATGHTTNSGTCSRCGENLSAWEVGEYTDEFNQPTGKKYMIVDNCTTTNKNR